MTYRYGLTLEYDGSFFVGWQWQATGLSVQESLHHAAFALTQERVIFQGAGRTDQGVHALGQVAHVDFSQPWSLDALRRGLNFYLKSVPISILSVRPVPRTFHARFSAQFRRYTYRILNRPSPSVLEKERVWWISRPLDVPLMAKAATLFQGRHDFSSFRHVACQSASPIKTLDVFQVHYHHSELLCELKARSFLHRQVRMMVGALVQVGLGKWTLDHLIQVFHARSLGHGAPTAPAKGLYLAEVGYLE